MRRTTVVRVAGAAFAALGLAVAAALPATAGEAAAAADQGTTEVSPQVLHAMQRDLGLTPQQAIDLLAVEAEAAQTEQELRESLGTAFGGAVLEDGELTVAVTDAAQAAEVEAAGAVATVVDYSEADLDAAVADLDAEADAAPSEVTGWYVDTAANQVVVTATETGTDVERFVDAAGVPADAVTVVESAEQPRTYYDIRGGDAYYPGGSRCSVGFSVSGGFVTAGHCGGVGTSVSGFNRVAMGSVAGSRFPGADMGWVRTNSNWTPRPWVNRYNGSNVTVSGSTEAAIGASICRSGSTTGWRCGTIQARNQTVRYAQGTVNGLTRTNACAEPGDSGGSWISGSQAQGVTSGGSGNCSTGGTTFFQPLNPILSTYGLSLTRG
ncbi:S1 family peptidase [Allonocardiopsis opalescens]|uniref:Streptogrisin C n=1 Tax=Allonocardiopsis opalescens TaxID=1144618 RepID=A0A2T0QDK1_9ACTN|nr:S1 family peptidase [Allonocardiopsis opalescens]PRY01950.1 streptogrisin C [Allonocardiopsis opalescens]